MELKLDLGLEYNNGWINIMGFDIGEKNFTLYIDKYNRSEIENLKSSKIHYTQRYLETGESSDTFKNFLKRLSLSGQRVYCDKFDMTSTTDKKIGKRRIITNELLVRLSGYLDSLDKKQVFDNIHYFIIEEQLKKAENNRQIQFHLRSYLLHLFSIFRPIIIFPSYYKTRVNGAPKKIFNQKKNKWVKFSHKDRKNWAKDKVKEILIDREDQKGIVDIFEKKICGKPDDVSDCVLQILSFVNLYFIDDKTDLIK